MKFLLIAVAAFLATNSIHRTAFAEEQVIQMPEAKKLVADIYDEKFSEWSKEDRLAMITQGTRCLSDYVSKIEEISTKELDVPLILAPCAFRPVSFLYAGVPLLVVLGLASSAEGVVSRVLPPASSVPTWVKASILGAGALVIVGTGSGIIWYLKEKRDEYKTQLVDTSPTDAIAQLQAEIEALKVLHDSVINEVSPN